MSTGSHVAQILNVMDSRCANSRHFGQMSKHFVLGCCRCVVKGPTDAPHSCRLPGAPGTGSMPDKQSANRNPTNNCLPRPLRRYRHQRARRATQENCAVLLNSDGSDMGVSGYKRRGSASPMIHARNSALPSATCVIAASVSACVWRATRSPGRKWPVWLESVCKNLAQDFHRPRTIASQPRLLYVCHCQPAVFLAFHPP